MFSVISVAKHRKTEKKHHGLCDITTSVFWTNWTRTNNGHHVHRVCEIYVVARETRVSLEKLTAYSLLIQESVVVQNRLVNP